jgi:hypothetical protein
MSRYLSAMVPILLACSAYAQEDTSGMPPPEGVPVVYVVLFGAGFLAMIVGFFAYLWWKERKRPPQ